MLTSPDVLVIGGGVIGLAAARELALAGATVEVLDAGEMGREASWAGAGIIPPGNFAHAIAPIDRLRAFSSSLFPAFSEAMLSQHNTDVGYLRNGGIEFLDEDHDDVTSAWRREAIDFKRLDEHELLEISPAVSPHGHIPHWLPGIAQIRNPWMLEALKRACAATSVRLSSGVSVLAFDSKGDRVLGVKVSGNQVRTAGSVLIAAGAWTGRMMAMLGCELPVKPIRGQMVLFHGKPELLQPTLLLKDRYLVPRGDGRILAGSTEEPEAGFENQTTRAGVDSLNKFARELLPSLGAVPIEASWAGLRPGSPDRLPYIGRVPDFTNLFVASGHFRSGIQLSLGTARLVRQMILKEEMTVEIDAFRLDRPIGVSGKPLFRS